LLTPGVITPSEIGSSREPLMRSALAKVLDAVTGESILHIGCRCSLPPLN
jgi:hypothetical protein